ncbi:MAG: hypothetical protein VYD99_02440 [Planctomycetota bacterium]|nr:hypothetical protein [Planctomycetota bacterium]
MPNHDSSDSNPCQCWIPVMATMLILLGLFNAGFALLMGGVATELDSLREQVLSSSSDMKIGKFFNVVSGGLLSVGQYAEGKIVKGIVEGLPPLWWMAMLSWARVLISLVAFALGWCVVVRRPLAFRLLPFWAALSSVLFVFSLFSSFDVIRLVYVETGLLLVLLLGILDIGLHLVWPGYILLRLRKAGFKLLPGRSS